MKPSVPAVKNISNIKTGSNKPRLIHFTSAQWKKALGRTPVQDFNATRHGKLLGGMVAIENPDGVVLHPNCNPGPNEVCIQKQVLGPGGTLEFQCFCRPIKNPPGAGGGGRHVLQVACRLTINRNNNTITCTGVCLVGRCRLVWIRHRITRYVVIWIPVCRCVRTL